VEGAVLLKVHQRGGKGKELISAELSVNKCWKGREAKSRWVISHSLKSAGSRSQNSSPEPV
jgi:hypothetical protein